MSYTDFLIAQIELNRKKTVATLERAAEAGALDWRPGEGKAHVAWQVMHTAATEESFAGERLTTAGLKNAETVDAYRHGSTPQDAVPSVDEVKAYLTESRATLVETIRGLDESKLDDVPEQMSDRGWSLRDALQLICWHECHHQGQAHITMNLFDLQKG